MASERKRMIKIVTIDANILDFFCHYFTKMTFTVEFTIMIANIKQNIFLLLNMVNSS